MSILIQLRSKVLIACGALVLKKPFHPQAFFVYELLLLPPVAFLLGSITYFLYPPSNVPQADYYTLAEITQGEIKNVTITIITTVNN